MRALLLALALGGAVAVYYFIMVTPQTDPPSTVSTSSQTSKVRITQLPSPHLERSTRSTNSARPLRVPARREPHQDSRPHVSKPTPRSTFVTSQHS